MGKRVSVGDRLPFFRYDTPYSAQNRFRDLLAAKAPLVLAGRLRGGDELRNRLNLAGLIVRPHHSGNRGRLVQRFEGRHSSIWTDRHELRLCPAKF